MPCCIPDLEVDLSAFVTLDAMVGVEDSRLIESREAVLSPSHDDGGLSNGSFSDKDQLDIVLHVLVDLEFIYSGLWKSLVDVSSLHLLCKI